MSRPSRIGPAMVIAFSALLLVGCTGDDAAPQDVAATTGPRLIQGAAPGADNQTLTAMPEVEPPAASDADIAFVHMMIPHHAQAMQMTALVPDRTSREDVPLFAERIELSQQDEIDQMVRWLEERDLPVPDGVPGRASTGGGGGHGGHDHDGHGGHETGHGDAPMPGMLTADQFERLEAAKGAEFDRLFLEYMYYHHDGALQMVQQLTDDGGGQEPELFQLTTHIDADQRIEMDRIQSMLIEMDVTSEASGG